MGRHQHTVYTLRTFIHGLTVDGPSKVGSPDLCVPLLLLLLAPVEYRRAPTGVTGTKEHGPALVSRAAEDGQPYPYASDKIDLLTDSQAAAA